jgi:hypothetical protein
MVSADVVEYRPAFGRAVFVFLSIPLVHRRVSPDINTPQSSS